MKRGACAGDAVGMAAGIQALDFGRLNATVRVSGLSNRLVMRADFPRFRDFLFETEEGDAESADCVFVDGVEPLHKRVIGFCVAIARLLLEKGNVPFFGAVAASAPIHQAQPDGSYAVDLSMQLFDTIPISVYKHAFDLAASLCRWMDCHTADPTHLTELSRIIIRTGFDAIQRMTGGGRSTLPVLRAAHAMDIPFLHLGAGVYQLGWGSRALRLDRSITGTDSFIGAKLTQNKVTTANMLRSAGLPAPVHAVVRRPADALKAAERLGFPLVVKPVDGERGEGVFVSIRGNAELNEAVTRALASSTIKQVVVERQVTGVCHRLFIVNRQLLYAVKRWPMSLRGDGVHTVSELLAHALAVQARRAPWHRSELRPMDERAIQALLECGMTPDSVPAVGEWAPLRRIETTVDGGVDEEVTAKIHPDNLNAAIQAAALFGLSVAGIDFLSSDIGRPWHENHAIINEVNFAPLLGGGPISRRHIPQFLSDLTGGDTRIPIESFDTEVEAQNRRAKYLQDGMRCFFTSSEKTIDACGEPCVLPFKDVRSRLRALIGRSDVDAITFCR